MKAGKYAGMGASVSGSFLSKRFLCRMGGAVCFFIRRLFRAVASFFHQPDQINPKEGPDTLQQLLVQFQNPAPQKTPNQVHQHYLILEKMMLLEIEFLREGPARAYVGMTKILDEEQGENVFHIRFVPCVVRPEVLLLGFSKN